MNVLNWLRSKKDDIAMLLSFIALLISAGSLYLSAHETDAVTVRIVDFDGPSGDLKKLNVKMVLANGGTLPYLISEITMVVSEDMGGDGYISYTDGSTSAKSTPFVLDKGEMELVEIKTPVVEMAGKSKKPRPVYVAAIVKSVDVYGEVHSVQLWFAGTCIKSGLFAGGFVSSQKFSLKVDNKSIFQREDANPCNY